MTYCRMTLIHHIYILEIVYNILLKSLCERIRQINRSFEYLKQVLVEIVQYQFTTRTSIHTIKIANEININSSL